MKIIKPAPNIANATYPGGMVMILTEADVDEYTPGCGAFVEFLFVPKSRQAVFFDSTAWRCLQPCLYGPDMQNGHLMFYDEVPQRIVAPAYSEEA